MTSLRRTSLAALATVLAGPGLLSLAAVSPATAATTTVDTEAELRSAVARANRADGQDVIRLGDSIDLRRQLVVSDDLVLDGNGHTLRATSRDRILDVRPGTTLRVEDVTLRGGRAPEGESGGAIRGTEATVRVVDARLVGNRAEGEGASGGAIMNDRGTLVVTDSRVLKNRAERAGGGIEANEGTTRVDDTLLKGNRTGAAPGNGGGLHLTGAGTVRVEDSRVIGNRASAEGGGLWNSATGEMTVTDTVLNRNVGSGAEATNGGGALFNDGGRMTVRGVSATGNKASGAAGSGGGLLNDQGTVTVRDSVFTENTATRAGGAIETNLGTLTLVDVDMLRNRTGDAPGNGGGLHLTAEAQVTYDGGTVRGNDAAAQGGGLWNSATGTLTVTDVTIRGNTAPEGADVYNDGGTFTRDGEAVPSDNPDGGDDGGLIPALPGIPGLPEIPGLPDLPLP